MRLAILCSLTACWSDTPAPRTTPVAPHDPDATVVADPTRVQPPLRPLEKFPHVSKWHGEYICTQGVTDVVLTITYEHGQADVVFEFGPTASNPVPLKGATRLTGPMTEAVEGGFTIAAEPFEWIQQPTNYIMVGFVATSDPKLERLVGKMQHPNCGNITVDRVE